MSRRKKSDGLPPAVVITVFAVVVLVVIFGVVFWLLRDRLPLPAPSGPETATKPSSSPAAVNPFYEIYFTTPTYPDKPENRHGGIDEHYVQFVDAATKTLDVADYDFDLENVAQAMARAKARGVRIRMVTDSDTLDSKDAAVKKALAILTDASIPIVGDERNPIMHDKFSVRDGEEIWTGSWNYTTGDTYRLNNNAVRMRSPALAMMYTKEFEYMFVEKRFGPSRPKVSPNPPVDVGGMTVQLLFSPDNGVAARLAERISQAQTQIRFLAFSFTQDGMGQAVINRAKAGVKVAGVFEKTGSETKFSEYGTMKQAGLEVYQDGNPYVMHHKVFVIDGKTTIFGSFNFSDGADTDNDENCLIVDDPSFASKFLEETDRMLALAQNPSSAKSTPEKERPR
jgi:phosphatidylserine/phosphatidylglycerophosphate/cardiolipin synthase-like enzyme